MSDDIDRAELRQDVAFAQRLTGTYQADSARGYYPAMDRIFTAVPALLNALEQAEARIQAVETLVDYAEMHGNLDVRTDDLRRALDA